jgi:hypothetical protein
VPAVPSPHLRRRRFSWPPRLLKEPSREVPAEGLSGGTHRARPLCTRFEPVYEMKDVMALEPCALSSATLVGPAPSGSADTSRTDYQSLNLGRDPWQSHGQP